MRFIVLLSTGKRVEFIPRLIGHSNSATIRFEASFTPDAKFVLCGSQDGKIHAWDVQTGLNVSILNHHTEPPLVVSFSPKTLLMASGDSNLSMWTPPF